MTEMDFRNIVCTRPVPGGILTEELYKNVFSFSDLFIKYRYRYRYKVGR